jgi:hypothetical protein
MVCIMVFSSSYTVLRLCSPEDLARNNFPILRIHPAQVPGLNNKSGSYFWPNSEYLADQATHWVGLGLSADGHAAFRELPTLQQNDTIAL